VEIVIDAIIYELQKKGGISKLFTEVLPRICEIENGLSIVLFAQGELKQNLPVHPRIIHRRIPTLDKYLRPNRIWQPAIPRLSELLRSLYIPARGRHIWHSTYYTSPRKWKGPLVVTVLDMIHELFREIFNSPFDEEFRRRKHSCVTQADAVICISETTAKDLKSIYGLNSSPVYVVPLACGDVFKEANQSCKPPNVLETSPFFLYIGTRSRHKNFDTLIQAYRLWSGGEDIGLTVVGESWSTAELRRLRELGILGRIRLLTDVDDSTLVQLYREAMAFIYPSLYEGFGIPLLEAMACNCTIIASDIPSTKEVVGLYPIYFKPTEIEDLIRAFDAALDKKRGAKCEMTELERSKDYSWHNTAAQTLQIYRELVGHHS
jgi:glycosyltransferase involved in cell wall biosynthesis